MLNSQGVISLFAIFAGALRAPKTHFDKVLQAFMHFWIHFPGALRAPEMLNLQGVISLFAILAGALRVPKTPFSLGFANIGALPGPI